MYNRVWITLSIHYLTALSKMAIPTSFSELDFKASTECWKGFVRAAPLQWADVKHIKIPFKSSAFLGQTLEQVVMEGGRAGINHLRRLCRWSDEFIDDELKDQIRVAVKYRGAYEKWLNKQGKVVNIKPKQSDYSCVDDICTAIASSSSSASKKKRKAM